MTITLVMVDVLWIHTFLTQDGMSPTISPRSIITDLDIDYNKRYKLEFGEYVQVHKKGAPP